MHQKIPKNILKFNYFHVWIWKGLVVLAEHLFGIFLSIILICLQRERSDANSGLSTSASAPCKPHLGSGRPSSPRFPGQFWGHSKFLHFVANQEEILLNFWWWNIDWFLENVKRKLSLARAKKYHKKQKFNDWFRTLVKEYIKRCSGLIYNVLLNNNLLLNNNPSPF